MEQFISYIGNIFILVLSLYGMYKLALRYMAYQEEIRLPRAAKIARAISRFRDGELQKLLVEDSDMIEIMMHLRQANGKATVEFTVIIGEYEFDLAEILFFFKEADNHGWPAKRQFPDSKYADYDLITGQLELLRWVGPHSGGNTRRLWLVDYREVRRLLYSLDNLIARA